MDRNSLRYRLNGISGSSCGHPDGMGGRDYYQACEKHHGDAAYQIVKQHLSDPLTRTRIAETFQRSEVPECEAVDLIVAAILGEDE